MDDRIQVEFLISKLLTVSENTIESLVKLKEEISVTKSDHSRHSENIDKIKNVLDIVLDKQKEIERDINDFKDRKPFEICDNICDDIKNIKTDMGTVTEKDKALRKLIIIIGAVTSVFAICVQVVQYFIGK